MILIWESFLGTINSGGKILSCSVVDMNIKENVLAEVIRISKTMDYN